jgi:hypothetical protein
MQQIVHGLRTRGSMDFDEICRVVPWINMAHDVGIEIHAPQVARPRAFKTHSTLDEAPKGAKYITVVRDPCDALLSEYHFFEGMFFEQGSVTLEEFARGYMIPRRDIWRHVLSFWDRRDDEDVLPLCYENIKTDLPRTIEEVAKFIGVPVDDELRRIVLRQSDIDFMREHKEQFEDHLIRQARSVAMRLPPGGRLDKVRNGRIGESKDLVPDEIKRELDEVWRQEITAKIGLTSYEDLRKELVLAHTRPTPCRPG